jgi:hypothetical protein
LKLAENVVGEVRAILEAGVPVRARERIVARARGAITIDATMDSLPA